MGTAGYISPEQAKGQAVDYRFDQFALGAILYEMATGNRAFVRSTAVETLSAIINEEPTPVTQLNPKLPAPFRTLVERLVAKEPEERYDSTRDLARDLSQIRDRVSEIPTKPTAVSAPHPIPLYKRRGVLAATGVLVVAIAFIIGLSLRAPREFVPEEQAARTIESLAVLPLDNISGDPDQEYFSDGMTEALIADLAKIGALRVISRQSVMRFRGKDTPLPEIAQVLNVDAVVEGSVLRSGDRVRITAQLVQAAPERHLWAESYERDVLSLQSEVARAIAREIEVTLTAQEESLLSRERPVDSEAYEAYLRGRYHVEKASEDEVRKAIGYFQRAIEIDPSYAGGYAGLAHAYLYTAGWGYSPPGDAMSRAVAAAVKAVELDDEDAGAHASLGLVRLYTWDWAAAEQELKKAIELNPGDAVAHMGYGQYLKTIGQQDEGLAEKKRALELDPLSLRANHDVASHLCDLERYDEAIEQCMKTLELEPDFHQSQVILARAYRQKGMDKESLEAAKKAITVVVGNTRVAEAMDEGYAKSGIEGARLAGAQELEALSEQEYVKPLTIAYFYALAKQKEEALHWVEKAYAEHDLMLIALKIDKSWDFVRSDPRFQNIMRRMSFPE